MSDKGGSDTDKGGSIKEVSDNMDCSDDAAIAVATTAVADTAWLGVMTSCRNEIEKGNTVTVSPFASQSWIEVETKADSDKQMSNKDKGGSNKEKGVSDTCKSGSAISDFDKDKRDSFTCKGDSNTDKDKDKGGSSSDMGKADSGKDLANSDFDKEDPDYPARKKLRQTLGDDVLWNWSLCVCGEYAPTKEQRILHIDTGVINDLPPPCCSNKYNADGTFDDTPVLCLCNNSIPPVGTVSSSSSKIETKVEIKIENEDSEKWLGRLDTDTL